MRMTKIRGYSLATMAMLALSGQAVAADVTCPAVSAIKEVGISNDKTAREEEQGDKNYVATEGGKTWKGSVSAYDKYQVDLKTLSAGKGTIVNAKGLVACDYSNGDIVTLRLMVDTSTPPPR
jgi:hypothetical protein